MREAERLDDLLKPTLRSHDVVVGGDKDIAPRLSEACVPGDGEAGYVLTDVSRVGELADNLVRTLILRCVIDDNDLEWELTNLVSDGSQTPSQFLCAVSGRNDYGDELRIELREAPAYATNGTLNQITKTPRTRKRFMRKCYRK